MWTIFAVSRIFPSGRSKEKYRIWLLLIPDRHLVINNIDAPGFLAQSYQCIIIHIYTVMIHTYIVILRKKRCQLYFRKKTRSQFSAISQYFRLLSRFSDISFPILICTSAIFIYRSPSHPSFFPKVCYKHAPQTTVL